MEFMFIFIGAELTGLPAGCQVQMQLKSDFIIDPGYGDGCPRAGDVSGKSPKSLDRFGERPLASEPKVLGSNSRAHHPVNNLQAPPVSCP